MRSIIRRRIALGLFLLFAALSSAAVTTSTIAAEPAESSETGVPANRFDKDVRPILAAKCFRCHGEETRKSNLNLSTAEGILAGGESGPILDAENPTESLLYDYVVERIMPPEDEGHLTDEEIKAISGWITSGATLANPAADASDQLTQHDALPILLLRCGACHGAQRQQAGLDIRSKAALLAGGKSGSAIVPGKPEESLILKRIHDKEMPPRKELVAYSVKPVPQPEIEILTKWIEDGAPEVEITPDVATTEPDPLVSDEDREFWSFEPPQSAPVPRVKNADRVRNPIDAFVLRKLEERGLSLATEADRQTLIRRAYFDLIGLPPNPEDVAAFISDPRPDAYERLIDRLLASPRYGERWGQYWLDLAGYSDSEGVVNADLVRKHTWRYRDYVIRAFNNDKPYDRFLLEQLAGDELADYENADEITPEIYDNLVATGFLRLAPDGTNEPLTGFLPDRLEMIDDEIEIFSAAVLGLTIKCARCHSHKFDPIPQRDYYRLAAILKGALDEHDWLVPTKIGADQPSDALPRWLPYVTTAERAAWEAAGKKPEDQPLIRALWDRGDPSPTYILRRGNYLTRGRLVGPGVPSVLTDGKTPLAAEPPWPGANKTGRRLALARWATQPDHPLTSRVMVNRVWKHHFGQGIVKTLDNFGKTGARPTHPELLDYLAVRFVADGWSLKSLHRLIMASAVYRQSSTMTDERGRLDPDGELLACMPLRRMDGEVLRDSLLAVAGQLDLTPYGPPDPLQVRGDGLVTAMPRSGEGNRWRRSIYLMKRRTQPSTMLQNFDVPRMNPNCIDRNESIVAPQALYLNNDRLVRQLATGFANRVRREAGDSEADQIDLAFRIAAGRPPTKAERAAALEAFNELALTWSNSVSGTRHEFVADEHLWIRETEPDRLCEDDLVSVWSSNSTDKGRRYGLISFDITALEGLTLVDAHLALGAIDDNPISQVAALVPGRIAGSTWNTYHRDKADYASPLEGLGHYRLAGDERPTPGEYAKSESATANDLARLQDVAAGDGRLTFVLMASEDGSAYRQDWDDGVYASSHGNPPKLVVFDDHRDPESARRKALENLCHALLNSAAFLYID